jgi:hypothetical protein
MKQPMFSRQTIVLATCAWALSACDEGEPFYRTCPLSASILALCEEDQPGTELTCVVTDHPMCDEGVCAAWEGSASFCSRTCTTTDDCPTESKCLAYLEGSGIQVCVPDVRPQAAE